MNEAGFRDGLIQQSRPRDHGLAVGSLFSLSAIARTHCVDLRLCALVFGLSNWVLLGHFVFLLFRPASRGASPEAGSASSRRCPDGVSRKKSRHAGNNRLIFSGGPSPGGRQSRGRACVGRAEGISLACPARENRCEKEA